MGRWQPKSSRWRAQLEQGSYGGNKLVLLRNRKKAFYLTMLEVPVLQCKFTFLNDLKWRHGGRGTTEAI